MAPGAHLVVLNELTRLIPTVAVTEGGAYVALDRYDSPAEYASWAASPFEACHYTNASLRSAGLYWRCRSCGETNQAGRECEGDGCAGYVFRK